MTDLDKHLSAYQCPYYNNKHASTCVTCELCTIKNHPAAKAYRSHYCGGYENFKECTMYKELEAYYERKYKGYSTDYTIKHL